MRSRERRKERDASDSPMARLQQMKQRRSPRVRSPPSIRESPNTLATLDEINRRIGHLLVRSGAIENKIDRLESETPTGGRDVGEVRQVATGGGNPADLLQMIASLQNAMEEIRDEQRKTSQQIKDIHSQQKKRHSCSGE
jgi:uncharacterized protein (UPF0335 family)